jgi:hypothetical protein
MRFRLDLIVCALLVVPALARAQAAPPPAATPVRQFVVYVLPYYAAGATFAEPPKVAVDPAYDKLLASTAPADIRQARDAISARPDLVKPETMMVLAIRLYDTGQRDDAVFWYYAGRDRFLTMEAVLDMRSLRLAQAAQTVDSFVGAIGPTMDGYALCDVARHQQIEDRAIAWVAAHPYKVLGYGDLPAQTDDRNAALVLAVNKLREASAHNREILAQPEALAQLAEARKQSQADVRFCWK